MSETDKGNMELPPVGVFVPDGVGITAWHAQFDIVEVRSGACVGQRILSVRRHGEPSLDFVLDRVAAAHLARLLTFEEPEIVPFEVDAA